MVDEDAGANPFQVLAGALDDLVAVGVLSAERRLDAGYPIRSAVRGPAVQSGQGPLRGASASMVERLDSPVLSFLARAHVTGCRTAVTRGA